MASPNYDPAKAAFDAAFSAPETTAESSLFDSAGLTPSKAPAKKPEQVESSAFDAAGLSAPAAGPQSQDEELAARFAENPNQTLTSEEVKRIRAQREKPMTGQQWLDLPGKVVASQKEMLSAAGEAAQPFRGNVQKVLDEKGYWAALGEQLKQLPTGAATVVEAILRAELGIGQPIKEGVAAASQNAALAVSPAGTLGEEPARSLPGAALEVAKKHFKDLAQNPAKLVSGVAALPGLVSLPGEVAAARYPEAEQAAWLDRQRQARKEAELLARQPAVPGAVPQIADVASYVSPGAVGPVMKGAALLGKAGRATQLARIGRLARISAQASERAVALTGELEGIIKTATTSDEVAQAMARQAAAQKFAQSAEERLRKSLAPLMTGPSPEEVGAQFAKTAASETRGGSKVVEAAGKGLQRAGQAAEHAVDVPMEKIEPLLDTFHSGKGALNTLGLGALAHFLVPSHLLELGGKGLAALTSTRFGAKLISKYGEALQKIGTADWKSSIPVWRQLAKDPDAPAWLKQAVNSGEGFNVRATAASAAEKGIRAAGEVATDAVHGAAIGGAASIANPDYTTEEKLNFAAQGGFGGVVGGRIMSPFASKAKARAAMYHDVLLTADKAIKGGANPISVMRTAPSTLFYANTLKHLFQGALPGGKSLDVRLVDGEQYAAMSGKGVAFYHPETGTAYVNVDAPDTSGRLLHETLGHALWESSIANRPEISQRIREALDRAGATIPEAELQYALKLHPRQTGEEDAAYQTRVSQYVAEQRNKAQATLGDADLWILGELHAEAAARSLGGDNILDLSSPVFWDRLGDKTIANPARSFFSDKVLAAVDSLHELPARQLQDLGAFRPGVDQPVEQKVPINTETFGKHPGAPVHDLGNGIVGNDFVQQTPDGRVVPRPPSQVKKIIVERQHEVDAAIPLNTKPADVTDTDPTVKLRRTPAGLMERSGTVLGKWFDAARSFGKHTKKFVRDIETAIKNGETVAGWYQAVGKGPEWKASVARTGGSLTAEHMDFVPYGFLVDRKGNLLVRNYSLNAFERKAREWSGRTGDTSLALWNGDIGAFRNDVKAYLKNHAEGKPGADVIGDRKRDVINIFLAGSGNRVFEAKNPLREHLKGADKKGIVRSFRVDRIETLEPSTIEGFSRPEYGKQLENFSPDVRPDMETARKIAEMSPEDFQRHASAFNRINLELGRKATPEDVTELKGLLDRAVKRLEEVKSRAMTGDAKALEDYALLSTLPQFFNEAIAASQTLKFSPSTEPRAIKSAAVKLWNGEVFEGLIHPLAKMEAEGKLQRNLDGWSMQDGYTTNEGEFLTREEAYSRAIELRQMNPLKAVREGLSYDQTGKTGMLETDSFNKVRSFSPPTEDAPVWRDNILEALKGWQGKGTPQQLMAHLAKTRGAADEAAWIGLDDFLKGKPRVTADEVKAYVEANQVELKEVALGGGRAPSPKLQKVIEGYFRGQVPKDSEGWQKVASHLEKTAAGWFDWESKGKFLPGHAAKHAEHYRALAREAQEFADNFDSGGGPNAAPKYSDRTLPGGENYREILFQLHDENQKSREEAKRAFRDYHATIMQTYGNRSFDRWSKDAPFAVVQKYIDLRDASLRNPPAFKSGHWDEPNVLAHTRVNDRTDTEGRPGLFVEEVQSDWHQKGRKEGYAGNSPAPARAEHIPGEGWIVYDKDNVRLMSMGGPKERPVESVLHDAAEYLKKGLAQPYLTRVPDAPFKKTWSEMVFRRLVREAVDTGKEWIGWTTGEQQADRYDLGKHLTEVRSALNPDGTYSVWAVDHSGQNVHSFETETTKSIPKEKLPDYVGKELAEKIVAYPYDDKKVVAKFRGVDLKVGGEGMRGFYDKILVDYARKFGKKFGAEVKDRDIGLDGGNGKVYKLDSTKDLLAIPENVRVKYYDGRGKPVSFEYVQAAMFRHDRGVPRASDRGLTAQERSAGDGVVHSLDITPAMRDSVSKGVDLFSPTVDTGNAKFSGRVEDEGGLLRFTHYSHVNGLTKLDPKKHGTGLVGKERERRAKNPDIYPPRSYVGTKGYTREEGLGKFRYVGTIEKSRLYDLDADPLNLRRRAEAMARAKKQPDAVLTFLEQLISKKYDGYWSKSGKAAALFKPMEVKQTTNARETKARDFEIPKLEEGESLEEMQRLDDEFYAQHSPGVRPLGKGEQKNEVYRELLKATGAGPFDGGCVVMAEALQRRLGGEIVVLEGKTTSEMEPIAQHAVLKVGDTYYDAAGSASLSQIIKRFSKAESVDITGVRPIKPEDLPDAPRDQDVSERISKLLTLPAQDSKYSPDTQGDIFEGYPEPKEQVDIRSLAAGKQRALYPEAYIPNAVAGKKIHVPPDFENAPLVAHLKGEAKIPPYVEKLTQEAVKWQDHPSFKAGMQWYSEFVPLLKSMFGEHSRLFAELLAATSPRNNPRVNFQYAVNALEGYLKGHYTRQIETFNNGMEDLKSGKLAEWYDKNVPPEQRPAKVTPATMMGAWVERNELVPFQYGKEKPTLFGMHSEPVLRVLARRWLDMNGGPKTRQFVENLAGVSHGATIDVWATRTLRRLGYDIGGRRWRILPEYEMTGLGDSDFAFGQKVFKGAADRLQMNPDDLQGAMWFAEKQYWADRGWQRMDLGDFRHEFNRFVQGRKLAAAQGKLGPKTDAVHPVPERLAELLNTRSPEGTKSLDEKFELRHSADVNDINTFSEELPGVLDRPGWAVLTATQESRGPKDQPWTSPENQAANAALEAELKARGIPYAVVAGSYAGADQGKNFLIQAPEKVAAELGQKYGQESVLTNRGLVYQDGSVTPSTGQHLTGEEAKSGYYTILPDGTVFSMGLDFDKKLPPEEGRKHSPMFDLDTIVGMNKKAADKARKMETETTRHTSIAESRGGVVLHSAKQRATVFLDGNRAKAFLRQWNRNNDQTRRDHLVESFF